MNALAEFSRIVRAYSADLYRYAYWLDGDPLRAEELVHQCFARARSAWSAADDPATVKRFLFRVLHNEHARGTRHGAEETLQEAAAVPAPNTPEPAAIRDAIAALPLVFREPLLLQVAAGFTCAEIGFVLNVTEAVAAQRAARARKHIRDLFDRPAGHLRQGGRS